LKINIECCLKNGISYESKQVQAHVKALEIEGFFVVPTDFSTSWTSEQILSEGDKVGARTAAK
jgi:hypothetical protein